MKKILLMAATAAMIFASCVKESGNPTIEDGKAKLTVKITGAKADPESRALEAAGVESGLTLVNGHIFVIDAAGNVTAQSEAIDVAEATNAGQTLTAEVSSDSRVYILGNIPSDVVVANLNTLVEIKAAVSSIANNTNYINAAMTSSDGLEKNINVTGTGDTATAAVSVTLSPLYSRMELLKLTGDENIVSFSVAGVYVDDYYASFTLSGGTTATQWNQEQTTDFTTPLADKMGNDDGWDSTPVGSVATAVPSATTVWAYHMASKGLPRFVIHLDEVVYKDANSVEQTINDDRYITVTGYTDGDADPTNDLTDFARGKIYRIGGADGIEFGPEDLGFTPNPTTVPLTVKVDIIQWDIVDLTPEL